MLRERRKYQKTQSHRTRTPLEGKPSKSLPFCSGQREIAAGPNELWSGTHWYPSAMALQRARVIHS